MSKTILIIDDERPMITYLSTLLEDHGYKTIPALDASEAIKMVEEQAPDLITLDLLMPDKTGISIYRELKKNEKLKKIPVIMVTGFGMDQNPMVDFKKFIYERSIPGPEAFIEKPVDPQTLLSAVTEALSEPASAAQ